jgi:transaldolase
MAGDRNALQRLQEQGQSPWLDYVSRRLITSGRLADLIEQGITGLTSNPVIFQKAIAGSPSYDADLYRLTREGRSVAEIYDALVLDDIRAAATTLLPIYQRTNGRDGLVSVEVPPAMAADLEDTLQETRRLVTALALPNVMIKIPATPEGMAALRHATAEGINVTITLLFSLDHYRRAARAYIAGLEQRVSAGLPVDRIASVAALYISRVDTAVDRALDELLAATGDRNRKAELRALQGKAAVANAKLVYAAYREIFTGPPWDALTKQGASPQRCLWASTGTKNPVERDVRYVEELIGPDTVNTMPPATLAAFLDHGRVERTLDRDIDQAQDVAMRLEHAGISWEEIGQRLQQETLARFCASFDGLIDTLSARREETMAHAR